MARLFPPQYVVQVVKLDGTVITTDLPVADLTFTKRLAIPGDQQLGSFSIQLLPARGMSAHYQVIYDQLDYYQRVEIYRNQVSGDPVFSGQITQLPAGLEGETLSGVEWINRLTQRKLRHYELIGGLAAYDVINNQISMVWSINQQIDWLLSTWQPAWRQNFNTPATALNNWTITSGGWSVPLVDGRYVLNAVANGNNTITRNLALSDAEQSSYRLRVDVKTLHQASAWDVEIRSHAGEAFPWQVYIQHLAGADSVLFYLQHLNTGHIIQRYASYWELPPQQWYTVDLWVYDDDTAFPGGQTAELWVNSRQFLALESDRNERGGNIQFYTNQDDMHFDNVIVFVREPEMIGTIPAVNNTDSTEFPGDSYMQALTYLSDQVFWEWRTMPKAGIGNDQIEFADTIGQDKSAIVRFEEGDNLLSVNLTPSANQIATWLSFKGSGQDENQRLAEAFDFDAWDDYGIIEDTISDQRISLNDLARQKVENLLVSRKDGEASLTASVLETIPTYQQWDVGDEVWIKSSRPKLDKKVRVVQVTRTQSNPERAEVVFGKFPYSKSGNVGRLMDDVGTINRTSKGNAGYINLNFKAGSRYVDDFDARIDYIDNLVGVATLPGEVWESWTGGLALGAYNATLHGVSNLGASCEFGFEGTGIAVISRTAPNLVGPPSNTNMSVYIDGVLQAQVSQYSAATVDQAVVWETSSLSSGYHTLRLERAGQDNINIFMALDAIRVTSYFWQFLIEGRAVNSALLSWQNPVAGVGVGLIIDNVDRTAALLAPAATGWTGDVSNLDVHQYISAPGVHTIEFVVDGTQNVALEANLSCKVLV